MQIARIVCDTMTDSLPDYCMPITSFVTFSCKQGYILDTVEGKYIFRLEIYLI